MDLLSNAAVTGAIELLNTEHMEPIKEYFRKKTKDATSGISQRLSSEEERKKVMNDSVDALKQALAYIRHDAIKDLKTTGTTLSTFSDYAYQKTLNSAAAENIKNAVTGDRSEEEVQRRLEKILYLYILEKGLSEKTGMVVDVGVMTDAEEDEFIGRLLADGSESQEEIKEMVRNLLTLFFIGRLGISGVQYYNDLGDDKQLIAVHKEIIERDRLKTLNDDIERSVNSKEFLKHFIENIVNDYNNGEVNDSKYYGAENNHVKFIMHRVRNMINEHNKYMDYIKSGNGLQKEINKINRLNAAIDKIRPFIDEGQRGQIASIDNALNNMVAALGRMRQPTEDGNLRVFTFKPLDHVLAAESPENVITDNVKIINIGNPPAYDEGEKEEGPANKRPRKGGKKGGGRTKKHRFNLKRTNVKRSRKRARTSRNSNKRDRITKKRSKTGGKRGGKTHKKRRMRSRK
jgi:hypothetical protein